MRQLLSAMVVAILFADSAQAQQPYDLRGIPLGIDLKAFRAMPSPDNTEGSVVCISDQTWDVRDMPLEYFPSRVQEEAGAIGCGYLALRLDERKKPPTRHYIKMPVNVATVPTFPTFFFLPDASKTMRLYIISIVTTVNHWPTFWEGYTGRYGSPKAVTHEMMGTQLAEVAVWSKAESSITLVKRFADSNKMLIQYTHKDLFDSIKTKQIEKKGRPKDNL